MKLVIGNKNYSSWSMRPWVLLTHFGLPFEEVRVRFDSFEPGSVFKRTVATWSGAGKVPLLVDDDGFVVWDSLAIAETLAERFPQAALWPRDARSRARARSLCAEMHSAFGALRTHYSMNIEAHLPEIGARLLAEHADLRTDLDRLQGLWRDALAASGGPFLFGDFTIADAFFSPVVMRLNTYVPPLSAEVADYCRRVTASPGVAAWIADALAERDFIAVDEPYRKARE